MPWDAIGSIAGIVVACVSGWNLYVTLKIRTEISDVKVWALQTFVLRGDGEGARRQAQQWRESMERISGTGRVRRNDQRE